MKEGRQAESDSASEPGRPQAGRTPTSCLRLVSGSLTGTHAGVLEADDGVFCTHGMTLEWQAQQGAGWAGELAALVQVDPRAPGRAAMGMGW